MKLLSKEYWVKPVKVKRYRFVEFSLKYSFFSLYMFFLFVVLDSFLQVFTTAIQYPNKWGFIPVYYLIMTVTMFCLLGIMFKAPVLFKMEWDK